MARTKKAAQAKSAGKGGKAKGKAANGKGGKQEGSPEPPAPPPFVFDKPIDIISPELLAEESRDALRKQYETSQPYTHCVMQGLLKPEVLARVRDEIVENIQATYKETDLFKVFQTGEAAGAGAGPCGPNAGCAVLAGRRACMPHARLVLARACWPGRTLASKGRMQSPLRQGNSADPRHCACTRGQQGPLTRVRPTRAHIHAYLPSQQPQVTWGTWMPWARRPPASCPRCRP